MCFLFISPTSILTEISGLINIQEISGLINKQDGYFKWGLKVIAATGKHINTQGHFCNSDS